MRISICVGNYAKTPYMIAGLGIRVFCLEELCYAIKENAYLLDTSLMNDTLVEWIGNQCGLRDLARELFSILHKKGSLSVFAVMILEYAGFYDANIMKQVETILKKGSGLTNLEKRKSQMDLLVQKKKYMAAIRGYGILLEQWNIQEKNGAALPDEKVKANIIHNKGVAFIGLMLYEQAAACFKEAYDLVPEQDYFLAFLAAKRMQLPEADYIAFATGIKGGYEATLTLEKEVEKAKAGFEERTEYLMLREREALRGGSEKQRYYEDNDRITGMLEESYRSSISE